MADIRQILYTYAREQKVRLDIVEKDYALGYLLIALSEVPDLSPRLVLKGGTALRKVYYPGYRFSEDLDYSTLPVGPLADFPAAMEAVVRRMRERLNERGPFSVGWQPLVLKQRHPGGQIACLVRVQFPAQRQLLCRLKVEITVDEVVLWPVQERPLLPAYGEDLKAALKVYATEEIVAEKLRALLQSRRHLRERGWGGGRICRDYYDLWWILKHETLPPSLPDGVRQKCALRGISFDSPQDFLDEELLAIARQEWQRQLLPFLTQPVSAAQVLGELQALIPALWNGEEGSPW